MQIITAFNNYLLNRGISEEIAKAYGLHWNKDGKLVIPVKDIDNNLLFNKYRRNPYLTTGPKYTYDKGAHSTLFGTRVLTTPPPNPVHTVIVCEGELDAVLITEKFCHLGIAGVSSTGGCGTWKEEWNEFLKGKLVYICYDSDSPGVIGAMKVHQKISDSRIVFLPNKAKDITELYQQSPDEFSKNIIDLIGNYRIPNLATKDKFTTESVLEKEKKELQDYWIKLIRERNANKAETYWCKAILEHINNLPTHKPVTKRKAGGGQDLVAAKAYKITDIIKFTQNKSKCIWHKDDSPSLTYYPANNTVYCFGCQKSGDAIDVYMQAHQVTFKEAVKALN